MSGQRTPRQAWRGLSGLVWAWLGGAGLVWQGQASPRTARYGRQVRSRLGPATQGSAGHGTAGGASRVAAQQGSARSARQGRRVPSRRGWPTQGSVRQGRRGKSCRGLASVGGAWPAPIIPLRRSGFSSAAGHSSGWRNSVRLARPGGACPGLVRLVAAGMVRTGNDRVWLRR